MTIKIEKNGLFHQALAGGINLFLGAGFSLYARDEEGRPLPDGDALTRELSEQFGVSPNMSLPQMSTILKVNRQEEFEEYLRARFRVGSYDEAYSALKTIAIYNIFTTNIDNLINRIYEKGEDPDVVDFTQHGPLVHEQGQINYIPLHGSVNDDTRPLVFASTDLASTFGNDREAWELLRDSIQSTPTLFWGYSLQDAGVLHTLFSGQHDRHKPKWIVLKDPREEDIQYFKALRFNIVEGDTLQLLHYFRKLASRSSVK